MPRRLFVAVAVVALVAPACRSTSNVTVPSPTVASTTPPVQPPPITPPPTTPPPSQGGQPIALPKLPAQGIVVQAGTQILLVSLEGKTLARLHTAALLNATSRPGAVLLLKGSTYYLLHVDAHVLRPIPADKVKRYTPKDQRKVDLGAPEGATVKHWRWATPSPTSSTLLAEWKDTCLTAFLGAPGGTPTPSTGAASVADAPESIPLGWTSDGKAVVQLPEGTCGGALTKQAGVYTYTSAGHGELAFAISGAPGVRMWGSA